MAVTDYKIDKFSETVTGMPDNPTMEGWSAQRIKERFDSSAEELRVSLNGLIDHINARDETIENKVDKQEGMDLSENNFTDEYKALVDTIGYKADRDNVIEKDSTVVFMPTEDAHPASKKYVDKKVNEKIMEIGSSDMTQAVYDPTGRQTDIFAEVDKKFDKTGGVLSGNLEIKNGYGRFIADGQLIQIEAINKNSEQTDKRILQISNYADRELSKALKFYDAKNGKTTDYNIFGEHNKSLMAESFLPLTGGTLTGDLRMKKSTPQIVLTNAANNRYYNVFLGSDGILYFRNAVDNNNRTAFFLQPETIEDFAKVFRLQKVIDGQASYYNIFGEHNKPSGSYTGNGDSTERVINLGINVGDSEVLVLHSIHGSVIVTRASALALNGSTSTSMPYSKVHLENEKNGLVINSTDTALNQNGTTYYYRVL